MNKLFFALLLLFFVSCQNTPPVKEEETWRVRDTLGQTTFINMAPPGKQYQSGDTIRIDTATFILLNKFDAKVNSER